MDNFFFYSYVTIATTVGTVHIANFVVEALQNMMGG